MTPVDGSPSNFDDARRQMARTDERAVLDTRELTLICPTCTAANRDGRILVHLRRDWSAFCSICMTEFPVTP